MRSRYWIVRGARPAIVAASLGAVFTGIGPAAAQEARTTQDPASAQPTLPKPMPDLGVPGAISHGSDGKTPRKVGGVAHRHHSAPRYARGSQPFERPALANVELLEPLAYPPQPPHVTVPTPAYLPDAFIARFTTPAPPVVCRPAPYDPSLPDPRLTGERPVVCTADNP